MKYIVQLKHKGTEHWINVSVITISKYKNDFEARAAAKNAFKLFEEKASNFGEFRLIQEWKEQRVWDKQSASFEKE